MSYHNNFNHHFSLQADEDTYITHLLHRIAISKEEEEQHRTTMIWRLQHETAQALTQCNETNWVMSRNAFFGPSSPQYIPVPINPYNPTTTTTTASSQNPSPSQSPRIFTPFPPNTNTNTNTTPNNVNNTNNTTPLPLQICVPHTRQNIINRKRITVNKETPQSQTLARRRGQQQKKEIKTHICLLCHRALKNAYNLRVHITKQHLCGHCRQTFTNKVQKNRHVCCGSFPVGVKEGGNEE